MMREAVLGALEATGVEPREVEVGHVGNFAAELYAMQGHLGAFLVEVDPAFSGLADQPPRGGVRLGDRSRSSRPRRRSRPAATTWRCVVGVEQMKTAVDPAAGGDFLGTAAWYEREAKGIEFPFPKLFGRLGDEYDKRFGLKDEHLAHISAVNYSTTRSATRSRRPAAGT